MSKKILTNKKQVLNMVGNWSTANVSVFYEFANNEITLKYNGQTVLYKSNNIKDVGYIALEFGSIGNEQYQKLALKF